MGKVRTSQNPIVKGDSGSLPSTIFFKDRLDMDPMDYIVRIGNLEFSCSWLVVGADDSMQSHAASGAQNQLLVS